MSRTAFRLDPQALPPPLTLASFEQGVSLYRSQRVLDCALSRVSQQEWGLHGSVRGAGTGNAGLHDVSVVLETSAVGDITFFSSQCSCKVARQCPHGVALVLKASYQSTQAASTHPASPRSAATPAPRTGFQPYQSQGLFDEVLLAPAEQVAEPAVPTAVTPTAHLHLARVADEDTDRLGLLLATLRFDYGGTPYYALHDTNPVLLAAAEPHQPAQTLYRDLAFEHALHHALRALGLVGDSLGRFRVPFVSSAQQQCWLHWADDGFAAFRALGLVVTTDPALSRWITQADTLHASLTPDAASTTEVHPPAGSALAAQHEPYGEAAAWFTLSLGMQVDGQRRSILPLLPQLLAGLGAATQGPHTLTAQLPDVVFWPQGDGSFVRVPTAPLRPWLQALLELLAERAAAGFNGDTLTLSRLETLRLGVALAPTGTLPDWHGSESLRTLVAELAGRNAATDVAAPDGLQAQLRPYQLQGLAWLQLLRRHGLGGVLADDMGLGKTLQTLAHVLIEKNAGRLDRPVLILAPVSLLANWRREAERFTPTLRTLVLHGKDRHGEATKIQFQDLVIAPYSLLSRDRSRWPSRAWHLVVLDEAQNIKNAHSDAALIASELTTRHRLCLSGTPMENHLGELWSLFHFLMPGFLGSATRFGQLFRTPIEKHGDTAALARLRARVTPFMLRRHKSEVARDLPGKQLITTPVTLGAQQADLYEVIRLSTEKTVQDALAHKGLASSQIQILDALLKLRQVCCDPRLVRLPAAGQLQDSAKLAWLMDTLPRLVADGRRVLVFSQFTSMLALIEAALAATPLRWATLTGQTPQRQRVIERFTSGQVPLFLISLKAGGVGLNLTQADTVIHYDPWWNPAAEAQATDRAHRIGQTRDVTVYKLVAQGTIEERILALQTRKAALASSLYAATPAGDGQASTRQQPNFTEADLAALLQPLGMAYADVIALQPTGSGPAWPSP